MSHTIRNIVVLGSTGSVGRQTLDVARAFPDRVRVVGLAAGRNLPLLAEQITEFRPRYAACLTALPLTSGTSYVPLDEMAVLPDVDIVVIATSGSFALTALFRALQTGKTVALANKEILVMAGQLIEPLLRERQGRILPVDSEHSAIWQCLLGEPAPEQLILTASGGPFYSRASDELDKITPQQALKHPSWKMGPKITIDSATLMNKGLEIIEAHYLFKMDYNRIRVVIHPESIIHALVEYADGSVKALASYPDMHLPIQYALSFPERWANTASPRLDWAQLRTLHFTPPDEAAFPSLKLARQAGMQGGTYPTALCAADEQAVRLFLEGKIGFRDIHRLVEQVLHEHKSITHPSLEEIMDVYNRVSARVMHPFPGGTP